jgi:hypothetical protein
MFLDIILRPVFIQNTVTFIFVLALEGCLCSACSIPYLGAGTGVWR